VRAAIPLAMGCVLGCGGEPLLDTEADAALMDARMLDAADATVPPDLATEPVPRFIRTSPLTVADLDRISRFRSSAGHDFSDGEETCRNMKHYFEFHWGNGAPSWTTEVVVAPVRGTISMAVAEQQYGIQLYLQPDAPHDYLIRLFHVTPVATLHTGDVVEEGQPLGTHASDMTDADVALSSFAGHPEEYVSFFDAVTDDLFAAFQARGVMTRDDLIISRAARDADPLSCAADGMFLTHGSLPDWVQLQ
jgi:hypothetical protein